MNRSYASPVPVKSLVPCTSLMGSPLSLRPKILQPRAGVKALAQAHPHLTMPGGCEIEVHEALPVPGM